MNAKYSIFKGDALGIIGIVAFLVCIFILSFTYHETYRVLFLFDRTRDAKLQPDLVSGVIAALFLFLLFKEEFLRKDQSTWIRYPLRCLFLYICAALAAGIIKGTASTGFNRFLSQDILTAGKYWPVLVAFGLLVLAAIFQKQPALFLLAALLVLLVFNLAPVSDAMGLIGFVLVAFMAIGFYALVDTSAMRRNAASQ